MMTDGRSRYSVVSVDQVSFRFEQTHVLKSLSLTIQHQQLAVILGASGSGKTTLLRLLSGLITPQQGRIQIQAQRIGMVFQDHRLLPWRSALENVAVGLMAYVNDSRQRLQQSRHLLHRCGFPEQAFDRYPGQLSGGMRSRVAIARALAIEPDLLLMDEPFNGLDVSLRGAMQDLVRHLVNEGLTVVFVTHDIMEAMRLADQILILSEQRLLTRPGLKLPYSQRHPRVLHQAVAKLMHDPDIVKAMQGY